MAVRIAKLEDTIEYIQREVKQLKAVVSKLWKKLKIALPVQSSGDTGRLKRRKVLHREIFQHYNIDELEGLMFDVGIEPESIGGDTKEERIREFIYYCIRRQRIDKLLHALQESRPDVEWDLDIE